MTELDRVSHKLGRIEGKLEEIEKAQRAQWEKLEKIEQTLTAHRLKVAGIAGTISALVAAAWQYLRGNH